MPMELRDWPLPDDSFSGKTGSTTLHDSSRRATIGLPLYIGLPRKECIDDGQPKGRKAELLMETPGAQHDRVLKVKLEAHRPTPDKFACQNAIEPHLNS